MTSALRAALTALPHGPSFRFVDELRSLEPGRSATASYTVRGDEPFLPGHFPAQPIMPGVILIEAIAQLAGIVAQSDPAVSPLAELRLAAVRSAKILGAAVPGQTLTLSAEIAGRLGPLIQATGTVGVGDVLLCTAQITLSGQEIRSGLKLF